MKKTSLICILSTVFLFGCSHQLTMYPVGGGALGQGVAEESGKRVTINLNGNTYTGSYVHDGGSVATFQSYGSATAFSGTKIATVAGNSFGSAYVPGSGNGRILAHSSSGDAIRCEFQYVGGSGIGVCRDGSGKEYDLQIK